jgi:hypothetical protein
MKHLLDTVLYDNPHGHIESVAITCFCGEIIKHPILDRPPDETHAAYTNDIESVTCEACKEEYAMKKLAKLGEKPWRVVRSKHYSTVFEDFEVETPMVTVKVEL